MNIHGNKRDMLAIIGILVMQRGGEVTLTDEDAMRSADLEVETSYDPVSMRMKIRARPKPETLRGEVVEPERPAIDPSACSHPTDRQHWNFSGYLNCGVCGETVGYDEQMVIRSINGGIANI